MAYDRNKIFLLSKELILKHKLFFVEDIVALLPINKSTFYEFFPINSNESNELKELLEQQKISIKVGMRKKWYESDAPALQIALMKIISTEDEAHRLNGTRQELKTEINDKRQGFIEPEIE